MATRDSNRPYAYPGNVMDVLRRYRSLDLPDTVGPTELSIIGVPQGNHGRTLFALRFLGLLEEDSTTTSVWRTLCDASEDEFRSQLGSLVKKAYADVLQHVQLDKDNQPTIRAAFQPFTPKSQIGRMVTFFLAMCREGGIAILDAPKRRPTKVRVGEGASSTERVAGGSTTSKRRKEPPPDGTSTLFGVTDEDIGLLDEQDFNEVWTALGKVARARARARARQERTQSDSDGSGGGDGA